MFNDDDQEKKVGYCNPPREYQFRPGQSGNPKGAPKGKRKDTNTDFYKLLANEFMLKIKINNNGKIESLSMLSAFIKNLVHKAVKGDRFAIKAILNIMENSRFKAALDKLNEQNSEQPVLDESEIKAREELKQILRQAIQIRTDAKNRQEPN